MLIMFCHAGEIPLCTFSGTDSRGETLCKLHRAKDNRQKYCQGEPDGNCSRYQAFKQLDDQAYRQFEADQKHSQEKVNSLVFNTFIFLQVNYLCLPRSASKAKMAK